MRTMTAGGFFLLDDEGMPVEYVDVAAFEKRERIIANVIAIQSRDPDAALEFIIDSFKTPGEPEHVRLNLACGVLFQLATAILGPFMTLAEATYPQNDYVGDLLALTNRESLQGDLSNPEGSPSEGD
ncbi:hypothetical protein [Cryobacterium mannosilyticum]|uniref:Uncharacterized protein n=1 Tax=Cryobacterium mannosilyticum TaxID=1259190 RepID=A0A4R8WA70_9MICO|nr:hypothetical protein [Cryobacterium mannosilyticum]TFC03636.1 hypothetical protein E3O32_10065 [Cryobacterium mannosilyticum]